MSALGSLLKVQLIEAFDFRKIKQDKKSKSLVLVLSLLLFFLSILVAFYGFMYSSMLYDAKEDLKYTLYLFSGFATVMCIVMSITKINSIFQGKDYDTLASMPISKNKIILAKLFSLYLNIIMYSVIIMLPSTLAVFVFSCVKNVTDYSLLVFGILSAFLIPAIPLSLAAIVSTIFTLFAEKTRFGNVLLMIFYIAYIAGILSISLISNSGKVDENGVKDVSNLVNMAKVMLWFNPISYLLTIESYRLVFVSIYIVGNILCILFVSFFTAIFYEKLHFLSLSKRSNRKYQVKNLECKNAYQTFLRLEFKKFFSSKMYLLNGMLSGVMCVIMCVTFAYQFKGESGKFLPFVIFISALFVMGIQTPAAISVNLEGKHFYSLKTMPINYKDFALAKVTVSVIITSILGIIGSILVAIIYRPSVPIIILFSLGLIIEAFFVSCLDFIVAIKNPKLDWSDEKEAVKQTTSVLISMFMVWGIDIAIIVLGVIGAAFSLIVGFIIVDVLTLILGLALLKILSNNANYYVNNIE